MLQRGENGGSGGQPMACRWPADGGSDGVQVASRWRAGGKPMACRWPAGGVQVASRWRDAKRPRNRYARAGYSLNERAGGR